MCDLLLHLHAPPQPHRPGGAHAAAAAAAAEPVFEAVNGVMRRRDPAAQPAAAAAAAAAGVAARHSPLHRIVIDEVQDLVQAEIGLLLRTAADKNGLAIFGDTAQTISRGVGFRFADVKELFHAHAARADAGVLVPPLQQLGVNYRCARLTSACTRVVVRIAPSPFSLTRALTPTSTHAGIVDCAACLVRLVRQLFPNAIDILDTAERGHFPGPPPALLPDTDAQSIVEVIKGVEP